MMTCAEMVEFLSPYLDEELGREVREAVEAHLSGCRECGSALRELQAVVDLCQKELIVRPECALPEEMRQELLRAFQNVRKTP